MDTTSRPAAPDPAGRPPARAVAVDVADPDLDADVRAVLAALALDVARPGGAPADALITDRAGAGGGVGTPRVVRVSSDQGADDDDEVVRLPSATADLVAALMTPAPGRGGSLVAIFGAVGGCGTSTLAAALAVRASVSARAAVGERAAASGRVLLVEVDPRGTGIDLVLGSEARPGLRVEDVRAELGGPDPDALWGAVPSVAAGLGVLARSRARATTSAAAADGAVAAALAHRGAGGLAVCDSGAFTAHDPLLAGADLVVVVTRADLAGAVAAGRAVGAVRAAGARGGAELVIRTRRGDALHAADVAESVGTASWHVLPEMGAVRRAAGAGELDAVLGRSGLGSSGLGRSVSGWPRPGGVRALAALADALLDRAGLG